MSQLLYKYRQSLTDFISSDKGQQFFNFAYSIGAAIVIWGALFKILHIKGGDMLLAIGMGTEVIMFILTAFDSPYPYHAPAPAQGNADSAAPTSASMAANVPVGSAVTNASCAGMGADIAEQMQALSEATARLNKASAAMLDTFNALSPRTEGINDAGAGFAEQMQALNKNIQGLNTIYEIQLKSVSSQLDSIDRVNQGIKDMRDMYEKSAALSARYYTEAEKMAQNMARLNQVYENMVAAMTINMNLRAHSDGIQQ